MPSSITTQSRNALRDSAFPYNSYLYCVDPKDRVHSKPEIPRPV